MTSVYVDRRGAVLDVESGAMLLRTPDGRVGTVPLAGLERVVVAASGSVSTRLLGALWENGTGLLLLSGRRVAPTARLLGRPHGDARIRVSQYALSVDDAARARYAKGIVLAKVRAQRRLLVEARDARPDLAYALGTAIRRLDGICATLDDPAPLDRAALLGYEGAAAAAHFEGLAALFPSSLGFKGRNRRPPRDPVNACLSLGYTLLQFDAGREAQCAGLDPMIGVLHDLAYGRDSLACDLAEPLRPHVDRWVWERFRERLLRAEHFATADGACLLRKSSRARFYEAWERLAPRLRRLLRRMCRRFARDLIEGTPGDASI